MEEAALKLELHEKIDHADGTQLRAIYGLLTNYFNGLETEEGWEELSEYQRSQILKGLAEAEAGLGESYETVTQRLRQKYGLNG